MSGKEPRKITSDKFTITLPKDWRDSLNLTPKDALIPFYQDGSPLVLVPQGMILDKLESRLVDLLVTYRGIKDIKKLSEQLGNIVDTINEGIQF